MKAEIRRKRWKGRRWLIDWEEAQRESCVDPGGRKVCTGSTVGPGGDGKGDKDGP